MNQVAVAAMELNQVVADPVGALDRCDEVCLDLLQASLGQRFGYRPVRSKWQGRWSHRRPGAFSRSQRLAACRGHVGGAFSAGMGDLYADLGGAELLAEIYDTLGRGFLDIGVEPRALQGNPGLGTDVGHLGNHQTHRAHGVLTVVDDVPVIGGTIFCNILAHGRERDAIGQRQAAQGQGGKQRTSHPHLRH